MVAWVRFVTTLFSVLSLITAPDGDDEGPLRVRVQVPAGTHYTGESVEFAVAVIAEGERPKLTIPRSAHFDITFLDTDLQPISASGIGDVVETKNLFRYRYRLIAKRAGTLDLPAVTARVGDRSGSSQPLRLKIKDPPIEQRPKEFLGGVGTFDLDAEVEPAAVRLGQTLEYRIRLSGPAARSSRNHPVLSRVGDLSIRPEVEVLESESIADPPSRVFRYRVRPTRAGKAVLPPVAVAAFDPRSARYVTKVTPSVAIQVKDVPPFAPGDVQYGDGSEADTWRPARNLETMTGYLGLALIVIALGLLWRIAHAPQVLLDRARAAAARRARDLPASDPPEDVARWISEGLVEYLGLTLDRAAGALTPREALEGIEAVTAEHDLAARCGHLVECCDCVCYGGGGPSSETLAAEGRAIFGALAAKEAHSLGLRKTKRGSPDREVG